MDILHLIDRLEEAVGEARKLPVGGGVVVSRQKLLDLIDRMRVAVPREVYDSREVVEKRDELLFQAQQEAQSMLAQAREELDRRLSDSELVKAAQDRSREVMADAQERAQDLLRTSEEQARARLDEAQTVSQEQMRESDYYALQTLRKLELELDGFLNTVRKGVDALEQRAADRPPA